jgi:hypothetical protein
MGVEVLTIKQTFINEAVCANVDEAAAGPMMDISPAQVKKIIEITNEYLSTFGCQRPPTTWWCMVRNIGSAIVGYAVFDTKVRRVVLILRNRWLEEEEEEEEKRERDARRRQPQAG